MKRLLHLSAGICAFLLSIASVSLGDGPTTVSFQGLLTQDGHPVSDGSHTIVLGLWSQVIGGSNLGSEMHAVTTSNGLFTVELSETFFNQCAPCDAWLQIEVMGVGGLTPLTPRTHLTAVAHALTSSTFSSEATSGTKEARGRIRVLLAPDYIGHKLELTADTDGDGTPEFLSMDSATTEGVHRMAVGDRDDDGLPDVEAGLHVTDDGPRMHLRTYDGLGFDHHHIDMTLNDSGSVLELGGLANGIEWPELKASDAKKHVEITARMPDKSQEALVTVDTGSSSMVVKSDPNDLLPNAEAGMQTTGSSSRSWSAFKTNTELSEAAMSTSDSGAALTLTCDTDLAAGQQKGFTVNVNLNPKRLSDDMMADLDGDGHPERRISSRVDSTEAVMAVESDSDGDGIPEHSVQHRISDRALLGLKNYDPLRAYSAGDDIILQTDNDESSLSLTRQSAPDIVKIQVVDDAASMKLKHYQPGQPYYGNFMVETTDSGATLDVTNLDDDGDGGFELDVARKDISIQIKSQSNGPVAHFSADSVRALTSVEADPDEDGDLSGVRAEAIEPRSILETYFTSGSSQCRVMDSADADGGHTAVQAKSSGGGCTMQCNAGYTRAEFEVNRTVPDPLSTDFLVAEAVTIQTAPDTARLDITEHSGNHADGWNLLQADGTCMIQGTSGGRSSILRCSDASCALVMVDETGGTSDTGIVIDAVTKRIGIGVEQPAHPLEHSSGAHLTAGGVWTNASDVALKENFHAVDGSDLLERIDRLRITRWNYRNESDDITHIGPTAQDFKHLFGVGDNDRTISTVDPSGIALAAIQQLHKENEDLRKQNLELQSRLEELDRKLDRVISGN